jgi:hypothetical protein
MMIATSCEVSLPTAYVTQAATTLTRTANIRANEIAKAISIIEEWYTEACAAGVPLALAAPCKVAALSEPLVRHQPKSITLGDSYGLEQSPFLDLRDVPIDLTKSPDRRSAKSRE